MLIVKLVVTTGKPHSLVVGVTTIAELRLDVAHSVLAAVAAGAGVVLILVIICCCWCCCCRKNKTEKKSAQKIYAENPPEVKGNQNGRPPQQRQHQNNSPARLSIKSSAINTRGNSDSLSPHPVKRSLTTQPQSLHISQSTTTTMRLVSIHSMALSFPSSQTMFTYDELAIATNGFSRGNILGQGGFGFVHKGVLPTGKEIAVKSLKSDSGQGEREFHAELETISRVHHRHLVSLVGYCVTGAQRLLVYELVPNKTLEFHLHGKGLHVLDWSSRMKIAIGAAKGLAYLHEDCFPKIIHRDIKAANILIDNNFEAKVADFGLAKFNSQTDTHVSTRVMGTLGYLSPEYAATGKLTAKSDVYSFGVVLLELITGRRPVDRKHDVVILVDWARRLLTTAIENETFNDLVDPRIKDCYKYTEMSRMVYCAATCIRKSAQHRPQMSQVVRALEGNLSLKDLSVGITPGRSLMNRFDSESEYNAMCSKEQNISSELS
ncbi:hypothetical protein RND81_07G099500 [Saponaria officinalis]|uniref:non-specific serine/threonine protein kinase n=1 Tax=Saponaria officinalis TaxID=3572 RepID=A0AAW1JQ06_SAPOF